MAQDSTHANSGQLTVRQVLVVVSASTLGFSLPDSVEHKTREIYLEVPIPKLALLRDTPDGQRLP